MALAITNVDISTHTFQNWLDKTNILLESHTYNIVTCAANSVGGTTTGNATVNGIFSSNTVAIAGNSSTIGLRGGNVTTNGVLYIISNTSFGNSTVNTVISTTTIDSDLNLIVLGNTTLVNTLITFTTNSTANVFTFGAANVSMDSGVVFVDHVNNRVGINNTAPGVALRVTGAADISSTANVQGNANVGGIFGVAGNTTLSGALQTISGNVNVDGGVLYVDSVNDRVGINNTAPGVALRVTGAVDISLTANIQGAANVGGTLGVAGVANLAANVNITGTHTHTIAGNVNFDSGTLVVDATGDAVSMLRPTTNTGWVEVKDGSVSGAGFKLYSLANNNLGANITSAQTVVTIVNTFRTGKLTVSASNTTQRQVEEILFCANNVDATLTVFGRVALPTTANLGSVTISNPNTTHLNINFTQGAPSTNVNISAVLFQ